MKKFLRTAVCCLAAILLCSGTIIGCSEYKKSDFAFGKHFKSGTPYTNGYAVVSEDDGEKVIDTDGKVIFSGNYDSIFIASPHLIGVEKAQELICAGADRIGLTATVKIAQEALGAK